MIEVMPERTTTDNYLFIKKLQLDTHALIKSSVRLKQIVDTTFLTSTAEYTDSAANHTTKMFSMYNTFLYPLPEFHQLFNEIKLAFHEVNDYDGRFYMQAWLNYYEEGQYLGPHTHWPAGLRVWHGYYCVSVGDSKTVYLLPQCTEPLSITSEDNLLVIGRSEGDKHYTEPWPHKDRPRITIAFDIVPEDTLARKKSVAPNHWIPV